MVVCGGGELLLYEMCVWGGRGSSSFPKGLSVLLGVIGLPLWLRE